MKTNEEPLGGGSKQTAMGVAGSVSGNTTTGQEKVQGQSPTSGADGIRRSIASLIEVELSSLPPWLSKELRICPRTGEGVHNWIFRMALKLHRHLSPEKIAFLLRWATRNCGRDVTAQEIRDAVVNSHKIAGGVCWDTDGPGGGRGAPGIEVARRGSKPSRAGHRFSGG